ncbi:putative Cupredoxin [Seiridium unicorne]|uniref:laccase n=1 Tax=Seiridium unicorne TaxID=138068 RepID=A0ABR2UYF8_9PEZI
MQSLLSLKGLVSGLLLAGLASAIPVEDLKPRASTCNTASDRACWQDDFSVTTDYEASTPAGTTRSYSWEVTEVENWIGPDGVEKSYVQLVNGQYPGPTLFADWGDTISVTIKNSLPVNGTSFHWHGLRQFHTNLQDGVNGVTECPIPPGSSKTYTFKAQQYGTSWYHSHTSAQYGNGVWGPIQIEGPASDNYDIDLGVFPINDYYYDSADDLVLLTQRAGPPSSDNILFNGTNINPADSTKGEYAVVSLTPGKRHRLRVINPSVENNFQISLVSHEFTVIATDLVPVNTSTVDNLFVGIGQRYDIIIDADQAVDNYWFNVTMFPTSLCGTSTNLKPASIFRYDGAPDTLPTDQGTVPPDANCQDNTNFEPVISRTADQVALVSDAADPAHELSINFTFVTPITWFVNGSAINVNWDKPVIQYVIDENTDYPRNENLVFVDEKDVWTYWVIQNLSPLPHPMHLHGHDFLVLGHAANTAFTTSLSPTLDYSNPVRRDVTMLPAGGYLVLAFQADNPGNWLFHCHIAWHVSGGLSADFMERRDEQLALISPADLEAYNDNCAAWNAYSPTAPPKIDSGLRM